MEHPNRKGHDEPARLGTAAVPALRRAPRRADRGGRGSLPRPGHAPQLPGPPGAASSNGAAARDWPRCRPLRSPSPPIWPNVRKRGRRRRSASTGSRSVGRMNRPGTHRRPLTPASAASSRASAAPPPARDAPHSARPRRSPRGRARGGRGHRAAPARRTDGAHGIPGPCVTPGVGRRRALFRHAGRAAAALRGRRAHLGRCRVLERRVRPRHGPPLEDGSGGRGRGPVHRARRLEGVREIRPLEAFSGRALVVRPQVRPGRVEPDRGRREGRGTGRRVLRTLAPGRNGRSTWSAPEYPPPPSRTPEGGPAIACPHTTPGARQPRGAPSPATTGGKGGGTGPAVLRAFGRYPALKRPSRRDGLAPRYFRRRILAGHLVGPAVFRDCHAHAAPALPTLPVGRSKPLEGLRLRPFPRAAEPIHAAAPRCSRYSHSLLVPVPAKHESAIPSSRTVGHRTALERGQDRQRFRRDVKRLRDQGDVRIGAVIANTRMENDQHVLRSYGAGCYDSQHRHRARDSPGCHDGVHLAARVRRLAARTDGVVVPTRPSGPNADGSATRSMSLLTRTPSPLSAACPGRRRGPET